MTTAGELWLDSELSRVVRKPLPRIELSHVQPDRAPAGPQAWGSTASASSNMTAGMRQPYGYGANSGGPALTDEDVRRLEHPEEFR